MERMDREEFFERLSVLDEARLKKALWNLYWRGAAPMRQRIEAELDPDGLHRQRAAAEVVDPKWTLSEVREFVGLARSGAYLAGDRRVSPRERTRWRFTFRRLVKDAEVALREDDVADGAAAMALLVDLGLEMRDRWYFRSEDPVEAARVVVSDEVALLWTRVLDRLGFDEFARSAAPQLLRWESEFGWTRTGFGRIRAQETSLAEVLGRMLSAPDMWVTFADRYLEALDAVADARAAASGRGRYLSGRDPERRAGDLVEWHLLLLDRLFGGDAEDRLDRLAAHSALSGSEMTYFRAQLANRRGDLTTARRLATEALERLPGHPGYLRFAREIDAPLPVRAEDVALSRVERLMTNDG